MLTDSEIIVGLDKKVCKRIRAPSD